MTGYRRSKISGSVSPLLTSLKSLMIGRLRARL